MKYSGLTFCVPACTTSLVIRQVCDSIWEELNHEMLPPLTEERLTGIMRDFWDLWQFPNCVGAIDGRHCILQNFAHGASEWYNYKGSFSMILMAVADARYRLTYVDTGARGRRSDGGVWEQCSLKRDIDDGTAPLPPPRRLPGGWMSTPPVFVADDAFSLGPHVMKPFAGQFLADSKIIFNYRLSRARRIVENVFAILSARWRVLRRSFIASKLTARAVIQAVVCLHTTTSSFSMKRMFLPTRGGTSRRTSPGLKGCVSTNCHVFKRTHLKMRMGTPLGRIWRSFLWVLGLLVLLSNGSIY
ncbi:hypothetical protein ONE63_011307 [Megalurothrips usitatus]|uniref:DDE Tnp4 domain-containing protein n=1 Tax=Megalurothrips usitatus TaxID=439358 RepID=A0AAV7X2T0_9NEOP|nr:hypothetical protein ONE63_011307 [Megalurothrips usitatus]